MASGMSPALPRWARAYGPYFEFTCLPTKNSDVLYVDDSHGKVVAGTADQYWTSTLSQIFPLNYADRYDVNAPAAGVSNGLGGRAKLQQLMDNYYTIIWTQARTGMPRSATAASTATRATTARCSSIGWTSRRIASGSGCAGMTWRTISIPSIPRRP